MSSPLSSPSYYNEPHMPGEPPPYGSTPPVALPAMILDDYMSVDTEKAKAPGMQPQDIEPVKS